MAHTRGGSTGGTCVCVCVCRRALLTPLILASQHSRGPPSLPPQQPPRPPLPCSPRAYPSLISHATVRVIWKTRHSSASIKGRTCLKSSIWALQSAAASPTTRSRYGSFARRSVRPWLLFLELCKAPYYSWRPQGDSSKGGFSFDQTVPSSKQRVLKVRPCPTPRVASRGYSRCQPRLFALPAEAIRVASRGYCVCCITSVRSPTKSSPTVLEAHGSPPTCLPPVMPRPAPLAPHACCQVRVHPRQIPRAFRLRDQWLRVAGWKVRKGL
jgi:hypothetical protein